VVISFGSVLELHKEGRGPRGYSSSEGRRLARDGRQPAQEEEEVRCYSLSEWLQESGNILDKSTRIAKG
jgi:hypothetical protein